MKKVFYQKFMEKWRRIEETVKPHISGKLIWDTNIDDEDSYRYVDDTLLMFLNRHIKDEFDDIEKRLLEKCKFSIDSGNSITEEEIKQVINWKHTEYDVSSSG